MQGGDGVGGGGEDGANRHPDGQTSRQTDIQKDRHTEMTVKIKILSVHSPSPYLGDIVSVLGQEEGYTVKYTPPLEGVPEGEARGNS